MSETIGLNKIARYYTDSYEIVDEQTYEDILSLNKFIAYSIVYVLEYHCDKIIMSYENGNNVIVMNYKQALFLQDIINIKFKLHEILSANAAEYRIADDTYTVKLLNPPYQKV